MLQLSTAPRIFLQLPESPTPYLRTANLQHHNLEARSQQTEINALTNKFAVSLMHLRLRRESKENYMIMRESKAGNGLQDS